MKPDTTIVRELPLQGGGKAIFVKVNENNQQYWVFPTADRVAAIKSQGWEIDTTVLNVNSIDYLAKAEIKYTASRPIKGPEVYMGYGSCAIQGSLDSAGIALRRAICTAISLAGLLPDAMAELRRLNGQTLDLAKSDPLNESVLEKI